MPESLRNRLKCLAQGWRLGPVRPGLTECLWRPFEYHGLARRQIRREITVRLDEDGNSVLKWRGYWLHWPGVADLNACCTLIAEIFTPGNAHYFLSHPIQVRPGDWIIDVGACEGLFGLRCAVEFGAGGVVAVEPAKGMGEMIRRSFSASGLEDVLVLVSCVAGAGDGTVEFYEDRSNPALSRVFRCGESTDPAVGSTAGSFAVPIKRLDTIVAEQGVERVDLIKVDAEGADLDVLKGAQGLLERFRPQLAVATYHEPDHAREMRRFLDSLGLGYRMRFRGLVAREGAVRPVLMLASCAR